MNVRRTRQQLLEAAERVAKELGLVAVEIDELPKINAPAFIHRYDNGDVWYIASARQSLTNEQLERCVGLSSLYDYLRAAPGILKPNGPEYNSGSGYAMDDAIEMATDLGIWPAAD